MNILHMKYAVEVAKFGSINKASKVLMIAQPNLSRSIKELEADLGIVIFDRSTKGMTLTLEGREFINHATSILEQIQKVERLYQKELPKKQKFSISVPRISYLSEAFTQFSIHIMDNPIELFYKETNTYQTVQSVIESEYKLGIIRYEAAFEPYFKMIFEQKELAYQIIAEFPYILVMHKESELNTLSQIQLSDLTSFIEIIRDDFLIPFLTTTEQDKAKQPIQSKRCIFAFERASQLELLSGNKQTFMWTSPVPDKQLLRYELVQRECLDRQKVYKDVLIYQKDYKLTALDQQFIKEVQRMVEALRH